MTSEITLKDRNDLPHKERKLPKRLPESKSQSISDEILAFISSRKSLFLSTVALDGQPYASYAPFVIYDDNIYVLISEIAVHATNLLHFPKLSVLIVEDEYSAGELFARVRVNYSMKSEEVFPGCEQWNQGIKALKTRLGDRIQGLSQLEDFHLFRLSSEGGRYVKGFAKAYQLGAGSLTSVEISHLRDGHRQRKALA